MSSSSFSTSKITKIGSTNGKHDFVIDDFCLRQFEDENYKGAKITTMSPTEVETYINKYVVENKISLVDGYAPFCKHIFLPNFIPNLVCGTAPILENNEHLLRSKYDARTEKELPVLVRYFPKDSGIVAPPATWLDIILYSREQIEKETEAMGKEKTINVGTDAPWGIISIKAQDVDYELPMQPITILRNALGKEYGGSGVPLDESKYKASVDYWSNHATIN